VSIGEVRMKSDGTPWRPLVHIEDISAAMVATVEAPRDAVHLEAFNVGRTDENYRIREVATLVAEIVPNCTVTFAEGAGPDTRNYRVDCDRILEKLPAFRPTWTVPAGIEQLYKAYVEHDVDLEDINGPRLSRIAHIRASLTDGTLDPTLRPVGRGPQDHLPTGALNG
jgi:nucleoside-diphosphate-sugar epimerase